MTRTFHGPISSRELRSWYRWFNRAYFDGKLPMPKRMGYRAHMPKRPWLGYSDVSEDGKICKAIMFNAKTRSWPKIVLQTMLHEMCHVKHPGKDCGTLGRRNGFHREIYRLERAGAFLPLL